MESAGHQNGTLTKMSPVNILQFIIMMRLHLIESMRDKQQQEIKNDRDEERGRDWGDGRARNIKSLN